MGREKPTPKTRLVESQSQLDELCDKCRDQGRFAFDTEFVMEDCYEAELCLVQLAIEDEVAILDPFLDLDLAGLWSLVCDDQVETIVHAGQEDLGLCVQHSGHLPHRIFDAQIAAGFVGLDYPLSLQRLVQAMLHIRLHKSKTLTDWRRRPLTDAQIQYAAEDVCHLLAVRRKLHNRLTRSNRATWAEEEFARFENMSLYRRAEEDKLVRLKGAGSLSGRQLATVHQILTWRETLAAKLNRPLRAVLRDHLLVEIARVELSSFDAIRDLRGLNLSDKHIRSLVDVVQAAAEIPAEKWPKKRPHDTETPTETALIALATAVMRGYCLDNSLAYSLVATKKSIRELIRHAGRGDQNGRRDQAGHDDCDGHRSREVHGAQGGDGGQDGHHSREVHGAQGGDGGRAGDEGCGDQEDHSRSDGDDDQGDGKSSLPELLQGWRGLSAGVLLAEVLAGRKTIRIIPENGKRLIRTEDAIEAPGTP